MIKLYDFLVNEYNAIALKKDLTDLKGKTFFITGANGLIGSNLVNYLHYLNKKEKLNIKIIAHSFSAPVSWLPQEKNIRYISADLTEKLSEIKFNYLIHTATYGQPKKFIQNKLGTIKLNSEALIKLLEMSKRNKADVLFVSSSEIYGQIPQDLMPVSETYFGNVDTLSDRAVYAESKRLAETICNVFSKDGLNVKIVRLAIGYGPGIKYSDTRFMNEFIKRALTEGKLTMMDSGKAIRCFCFISDVIEMMLNVLFSSKDILYNIAGADNKTVREVAEMITKYINVPLIFPKDEEKISGTPSQLVLSKEKYCTEFLKTSFVNFEHGLKKTIEWIKILGEKQNG